MTSIQGKVVDEKSQTGIATKVSVKDDHTGLMIANAATDKDGNYKIDMAYNPQSHFHIYYFNDDYFFRVLTLSVKDILENKVQNFETILRLLEIGKVYQLENINFFGNEARVIPNSYSSMQSLAALMKINPKMKIRICGYVNGCSSGLSWNQTLSENRANTIMDYLLAQKIAEERISKIGFGCQNMMYPNPKNEYENEQNRRVEIQVLFK